MTKNSERFNLIELEQQEIEGKSIDPATKYAAAVMYFLNQGCFTIQELSDRTRISRASIQSRILDRKPLGKKVLSSLAKAWSVEYYDMPTIGVQELRKKIDSTLTPPKQIAVPAQTTRNAQETLNLLLANYHLLCATNVNCPQAQYAPIALSTYASLKSRDLQFKHQPTVPIPPKELSISSCAVLHNLQANEARAAFVTMCLGSREVEEFYHITLFILQIRNVLDMLLSPDFRFVLFVQFDPTGPTLMNEDIRLHTLAPRLVDRIIALKDNLRLSEDVAYSEHIFSQLLGFK